jgi:hypothetical protein
MENKIPTNLMDFCNAIEILIPEKSERTWSNLYLLIEKALQNKKSSVYGAS